MKQDILLLTYATWCLTGLMIIAGVWEITRLRALKMLTKEQQKRAIKVRDALPVELQAPGKRSVADAAAPFPPSLSPMYLTQIRTPGLVQLILRTRISSAAAHLIRSSDMAQLNQTAGERPVAQTLSAMPLGDRIRGGSVAVPAASGPLGRAIAPASLQLVA
jgi:hypothetical protein